MKASDRGRNVKSKEFLVVFDEFCTNKVVSLEFILPYRRESGVLGALVVGRFVHLYCSLVKTIRTPCAEGAGR